MTRPLLCHKVVKALDTGPEGLTALMFHTWLAVR